MSWILVARILGKDGYGQFGIIRSTVLMFSVFSGFSLGITASKYIAEFINVDVIRAKRIAGLTLHFSILIGLTICIIFFLLAPWLAKTTLNAPELTIELQLTSVVLLTSSINGAQIGTLQGLSSYKMIAIINIIQGALSFPLFIVGAIYFGVYGTIWAFVINSVIICIMSYMAIRIETKKMDFVIDHRNAWNERRVLFSYSLPAFLTGVLVTPVQWLTESILVSSSGFSEMGVFSAALILNSLVIVGANVISAPFITLMSKNKSENRDTRLSKFNILAPWFIGILFVSPFILFPEVGSYLFGSSYQGSEFNRTLVIIASYTLIIMFRQGITRTLIVYDKQWWGFIDNFLWAFILVTSFELFEEKNSITLALAYFMSYVINSLLLIPFYQHKGLLPKKFLYGRKIMLIWLFTLFMILIGFFNFGLPIRFITFGICLPIIIFLFYKSIDIKE